VSDKVRLVVLSFLMLFVELALIRWTGSNVVYLSYFSNFVLLASFLGIGLGFLRAKRRLDLFPFAPVALAGLVAFVRFFPVEIRQSDPSILFFGYDVLKPSGPPMAVALTILFLAVACVMAFIAEGVARTFARFDPLEAYRLDIVGSILGIAAFTLLSFLRAPSVAWGAVAGAIFLILVPPRVKPLQLAAVAGMVGILAAESLEAGISWSPYYKVEADDHRSGFATTVIAVNGIPHQSHIPASRNLIRQRVLDVVRPKALDDVLIIGAGGGNDVAWVLDAGAGRVDAVEIDPRLYELGRDRHPDRPYQDPRVRVHINDGRAFMERTDQRYDLVLFALPDSLTLVSNQSALRLESYLFTTEALAEARDHLEPGGIFVMYNYYRQQWLFDRLARTLDRVYGRPPCGGFVVDGSLGVLASSRDPQGVVCRDRVLIRTGRESEPARDDHPFPYLRIRTIPFLYLATCGLILLGSAALVRGVAGSFRPMLGYADLFCMGAAFLLLETKNVVQFALLFGTTWLVNALVFVGILLSVLAAIEVSRRLAIRRPARLYPLLLLTLGIAWLVQPNELLSLPVLPRFVAATAIAFGPIFIANLIFTQRFKDVDSSTAAFGANLLGAMVGGLLEYGALVTGYRALLIAVAVLYGLAFLGGRRNLGAGGGKGVTRTQSVGIRN
jgi:SAM-dependent methyltransferase